jgi:hypothetical protein
MAGADVDPRLGTATRQAAGMLYLIGSSHELMQNVCNYFYEMAKASGRQTRARRGKLDLRAQRDLSQKWHPALRRDERELPATRENQVFRETIGPSSTYPPPECKCFRSTGSLGFAARPAA